MCKTEQGSLSIVALTKGHGAGVGLKVVVAAVLDPQSAAERPARGGRAGG